MNINPWMFGLRHLPLGDVVGFVSVDGCPSKMTSNASFDLACIFGVVVLHCAATYKGLHYLDIFK